MEKPFYNKHLYFVMEHLLETDLNFYETCQKLQVNTESFVVDGFELYKELHVLWKNLVYETAVI